MRQIRPQSAAPGRIGGPAWRPIAARWIALAAAFIAGAAEAHSAEPVLLHGRTMGTTYTVRFWRAATTTGPTAPELQRSIDELLARIDDEMSTWRDDSELSRFNRAPADAWVTVSAETADVVRRSLDLHQRTGGVFDVTMSAVVRAWGFGPRAAAFAAPRKAPTAEALATARARTGAQHLRVRLDPPALRKTVAGLEVDLSSIAPGYAVDLIVEQLAADGITNAMAELGGEVRVAGTRPDGSPWRIGVQSPPPRPERIALVLPIVDAAVATSGDFQQFRTVDGEKLAHIVDPRTGRPLPYRGACVTVVAETCVEADGLATSLFVMGVDGGLTWCEENQVAALFQARGRNGAVEQRASPKFRLLMRQIRNRASAK